MTATLSDAHAAWYGEELARSNRWVRHFEPAHVQEIEAALGRVRDAPCFGFTRADFPLPRTAALLDDIMTELEDGYGMVRLRGLDASRYSVEELRRIFWGIGCHLGTALYQNASGE